MAGGRCRQSRAGNTPGPNCPPCRLFLIRSANLRSYRHQRSDFLGLKSPKSVDDHGLAERLAILAELDHPLVVMGERVVRGSLLSVLDALITHKRLKALAIDS
jgi:hypothetical protein